MSYEDRCLRFVFEENSKLSQVVLTEDHWHAAIAKYTTKRSQELGKLICQQFQQYFQGNRQQFDILLELIGTSFQKQV